MPAPALIFVVLAAVASFLESSRLLVVADDCPLDMSWSNFTWAASACSIQNERAKCCRYLNAFVTVSVARYANSTGNFGVPLALNDVCLNYVTQTFLSNGIPHNATLFCGIGPKIHVSYQCQGITSGSEFLQTPYFDDVIRKCKTPLSLENSCRRCVNSSIIFLHHLIGAIDNVTLNTCRDAAFVALANQGDNASAIDLASCFFSIKELQILPVIAPQPSSQQISPALAPTIASAEAPQQLTGFPIKQHRGTLRLGLFPGIGIMVTSLAIVLVIVLILLIRKKSGELKSAETTHSNTCDVFHQSHLRKYQEGSSIICQRFRYNEIKKATNNFSNIIGRGGFGTVYKAQFAYGTIAAVKRMNPVAENHKRVFCREMELHSRLHHRHLVAFRGFCVERSERFLVYEYMENGSLKDYLHSSEKTPLTWEIRIQIAIDVANALEYLHFYCDPPLCHRDIKSSNILLDKNFLAKVADFGLAHASTRDESVTASSVKLYIHGTPGYVDPEYVVTRQLTEKSDVYSYGMLLLELVTGRHAIHDNRNLIEWSQEFIETNSTLFGLVDPKLRNTFDEDQLEVVIGIVKWCTHREGCARPSMKQLLRLLHESLNPLHGGFVEAMEDEGRFSVRKSGKGFTDENEVLPYSDDGGICLQSSSSTTTRSFCSRSVLLDCGSPQSPSGITSI